MAVDKIERDLRAIRKALRGTLRPVAVSPSHAARLTGLPKSEIERALLDGRIIPVVVDGTRLVPLRALESLQRTRR